MSLSIPGSNDKAPAADAAHPAQPPEQTGLQEMEILAETGFTAQQISIKLEVPLSQVDSALGLQTTAVSSATAIVAADARLSVHA